MISTGLGIGATIVLVAGLFFGLVYQSTLSEPPKSDGSDLFRVLGAVVLGVAARILYVLAAFIGVVAGIFYLCGS